MQMTRQGVRDLNGPKMDGRYNGRRIQCDHHRDPTMPTSFTIEVDQVIVYVRTANGRMEPRLVNKRQKRHFCINCGEERDLDGN